MYLSLDWLKDFVEIPKNLKDDELGSKLTVHTVEIDGVESQADKYKNVVVGKILEIKKHPKADKLQLAIVDVKSEKLSIVCGAPNIEVGQMVPVALVGAVLPGDFEIKPAVIRGEESFGMMCAEDELGLGEDHSGIMQLDESAKVGDKLSVYLNLNDTVFEVDNKSITNRPDLWSHHGMAREISTFLKTKLIKDLSVLKKEEIEIDGKEVDLKVKIENKSECQRYMAVVIAGIEIEASPKWMQARLISADVKPINNIVDISNYVMLDLGQPMHAFDMAKIAKEKKIKISVRQAKKEETVRTLDGETKELDTNDIVIANDKEVIAIAGLMGGENSEVDEKTKMIVLESANFNSASIRKSSGRLGLRTEASQRFEKSLDPNFCEIAIARAVELVKQICPNAKVVSDIIDEGGFSYQKKEINIDLDWLENFLGLRIDDKEIVSILESLGFDPKIENDNLLVKIPSWRATKDISIKEDIAEELARIHGYANIEAKMPKIFMQAPFKNPERKLETDIRNILSSSLVMSEVNNYSFVGEEQLKALGVDDSSYIRLANPITSNHTMLRQSLATNLFGNVKKNQAKFDSFKIFEIGKVFLNLDSDLKKSNENDEMLPLQEKRLGILFAGSKEEIYLDIKGSINHLITSLGLCSCKFCSREKIYYWSNEQYMTEIRVQDKVVGIMNILDPRVARKMGIKKEVAIAELYIPELLKLVETKGEIVYKQADKYPTMQRDLAFILDESITYNSIKQEIQDFHEFVARVELFDEYHGDKLGESKKSLAFHVTYSADKTLASKEVDEIQANLLKHFEEKFEAKIRDF